MNVETAVNEVRNKINDRDAIGLDDEELLSYLNESIQFICTYLAGSNSPLLAKEAVIEESPYVLPDNFVRFAGSFPLKMTGKVVTVFDTLPLKIRYFCTYDKVEMSDEMPFTNSSLNQVAIKLAGIYANAQQQFDITQDKGLCDEIVKGIAAAVGGVGTNG